jgi:hypothetical protein
MHAGAASSGWFSVCSFRESPTRLVVNRFDAQNALQGTNTCLGADRTAFSFYAAGAGGPYYSQDARNPAVEPRILAHAATGPRFGSTWFACELSPSPDDDFADVIVLVEMALTPVETRRTSWSRVRGLYR